MHVSGVGAGFQSQPLRLSQDTDGPGTGVLGGGRDLQALCGLALSPRPCLSSSEDSWSQALVGSCPPRWRSPDQAPWPPVATDGRPLASPCPAASCGTALPALRLLLVCDSDLRAGLPVSSISLPSPCPLRLQNETPSLEIRSGVGESRPQGASAEAAVSALVRHAGDGVPLVWSGDPQPPLARVLGVLQGHPWPPSLGSFPGAPER